MLTGKVNMLWINAVAGCWVLVAGYWLQVAIASCQLLIASCWSRCRV